MKPMLTIDELITHMEKKGIRFTIVSKEEAANFLAHNNYYMKLASYRRNYEPIVYVGEEIEHVHILGKAVAFQSDVR